MGKDSTRFLGVSLVLAVSATAGGREPGRGSVEIRVIDRDGGQPVAGVAIIARRAPGAGPSFRGTTDRHGTCSVPVPADPAAARSFTVHAWKDGFVPLRIGWGSAREFEFEGIPASYAVALDRGVPIGGVVRDEQGRPVAGARLFPTFAGARRSDVEWIEPPWELGLATDDQGRWRCAILPDSCEAGEMLVRVEHPRFLGSARGTYDRRLPIRDLRALSAVLVLQTGFTLSGTVVDPQGRPIDGAAVVWRGVGDESEPLRVKSDASGRFRFENRPPGISFITAESPGLAADVKQVDLGPRDPGRWPPSVAPPAANVAIVAPAGDVAIPAPTRILAGRMEESESPLFLPVPPDAFPGDALQRLKDGPCEPPLVLRPGPGRTIRGRVVDARGRPAAGVRVAPEFHGMSDVFAWRAETGADGRFAWMNAPRTDLVLHVENPAELQSVRRPVSSSHDGEFVLKLPPPFRLCGAVVDAETGRPIERFRLIEGDVWTHDFNAEEGETPPDWSNDRARTIDGGRYEVRFPPTGRPDADSWFQYTLLVIRVEAEGYAPQTSRRYRLEDGEQTCDFALRKQPWIKGVVRAPDGSPAAGAEVIVAAAGGPSPRIDNGRLAKEWRGDVVRAGPDGRYAFPRPAASGRIVVVGDHGLAQRTVDELAAEPDITLEPWGSIRGQLRVGTGVGARRLVSATSANPDGRGKPIASFFARTLTDAQGRFVLERVPPGHAMVYRPSWLDGVTTLRSHREGIEVAAGRATEVIVGGTGRPVVGRVARAAGLPAFGLEGVKGRLRFQQPPPEFPEGFDEWEPARRDAWWFAFYQTDEGRAYYERANGAAVKVGPDGSFRLDDVPEGRYRLSLEYTTVDSPLDNPDSSGERRTVAVLTLDLDVPTGPDETPMDLGTLTLTPPEPEAVDR